MITRSNTQPAVFGSPIWYRSGSPVDITKDALPALTLQSERSGYEVASDGLYTHPFVEGDQSVVRVDCLDDGTQLQRNITQNSVDSEPFRFWTHANLPPGFNPAESGIFTFLDRQDPLTAGWGVSTVGGASTVTYDSDSERIIVQSGPDSGNSALVYSPIPRNDTNTYLWLVVSIKNLKFIKNPAANNGFLGSVDLAGYNYGDGNYFGLFAVSGGANNSYSYTNAGGVTFNTQAGDWDDEHDYQLYFDIENNKVYIYVDWEPLPRSVYQGPMIDVASTLTNFSIFATRTASAVTTGHSASFQSVTVGYW